MLLTGATCNSLASCQTQRAMLRRCCAPRPRAALVFWPIGAKRIAQAWALPPAFSLRAMCKRPRGSRADRACLARRNARSKSARRYRFAHAECRFGSLCIDTPLRLGRGGSIVKWPFLCARALPEAFVCWQEDRALGFPSGPQPSRDRFAFDVRHSGPFG